MTKASYKDQPTALNLSPIDPLPEDTARYFAICEGRLGLVPNVLRADAFNKAKLDAFSAMYNELMLCESGPSKLEREMIAMAVSPVNKCSTASPHMVQLSGRCPAIPYWARC